MTYMALYRKFRPKTFNQVKGQDHVVQTLKNQIKNGRIGHAYLFTGTRGTGKTSVAKLFARAINCVDPQDGGPCNCCENCVEALKDAMMDIVEVDAASNTGVDDIRRIIDEVQYSPVKGKYKVYIVDEVHMLTTQAFNAFLKTLEEPPSYVVFILATTEPHKLPITILSRCQRYDFRRISNKIISENLKEIMNEESLPYEDKAVDYIARLGDGSMRDAISLLDKCIAFSMGEKLSYDLVLGALGTVDTEVFSEIFKAVFQGNAAQAVVKLENAVNEGKDIGQFVSDFLWYLRNIFLVRVNAKASENILGMSPENIKKLKDDAAVADEIILMRYIRILSELLNNIRYSTAKQVLAEVAFVKMAKPEMEVDTVSLLDRIRHLEMMPAIPSTGPVEPQSKKTDVPYEVNPEITYIPDDYGLGMDTDPAGELETGNSRSFASDLTYAWNDVVDACPSPLLKIALKRAHPVQQGDVVEVHAVGTAYGKIKENADTVESLINQVCGQNIKVNVVEGETESEKPQNTADTAENFLKNINFNIGTEES